MSFGVTFPFALATGSLGYLEVTADVASAIRSNLNSLLLTNWGERVMHFDFGCNMREFLFEPATEQLRARIADRVRSQLAKWMPFLKLVELYVRYPTDDPSVPQNGFKVVVKVVYGNITVEAFQSFPSP